MRKSLILFLLTVVSVFSATAQYQHWEWAKSYGGTGTDSSVDIKLRNGYLYVTGNFTSSQINWENTTLTNHGGTDIFVAKLDTNGNTIWVKSFGNNGNDKVQQLEVNSSGTSVLRCISNSSSVNTGAGVLNNPAFFYIELDAAGNTIAARKLPNKCSHDDIDIAYDGAVYVSGTYRDSLTFAGNFIDTSYTKAGAFIFKYAANGNELSVRYLPCFNELHAPYDPWNTFNWQNNENITLFTRIEYSDIDTSIVLFTNGTARYHQPQYLGYILPGNPAFTYNAGNSEFRVNIYARLGNDGIRHYSETAFPSNGSFDGYMSDFETGINGLVFSMYSKGNLSGSIDFLRRDYNETRGDTLVWIYSFFGPSNGNPFDYGTMKLNEHNDLLMLNYPFYERSTIEFIDTNLNRTKKIIIPAFGPQKWNNKCMADTNAIYFAESYFNRQLVLNNGTPAALVITLNNNGASNIFIGKYIIDGKPPVSISYSYDRYKICADSISPSVSIATHGAGQLTYAWHPATGMSDSTILNPNVFITSDSITSTLTVTDIEGVQSINKFVFFKGSISDIRLMASDTIVCRNDTVTLTLQGTNFTPCSYWPEPYQSYVEGQDQTPTAFNSINEVCKYVAASSHTLTLRENYYPSLPVSSYCIAQNIKYISVKPSFSSQVYNHICYGDSYVFPDGSIQNNIYTSVQQVSHFTTATTCDSAITTILSVDPVYTTAGNYSICAGSSYTFPDNSTISNINADITHTSHFNTINGCDSNIVTTLTVINTDTSVTKDGHILTANAVAANYQWLDCNNTMVAITDSVNRSFTASSAGSYAVVISGNGCRDTSACYIISTADFRVSNHLTVNTYPVPAGDMLNMVIFSPTPANVQIFILDPQGVRVSAARINILAGQNVISRNIATLQAGVYTVEVINTQTGDKTTSRIIKN